MTALLSFSQLRQKLSRQPETPLVVLLLLPLTLLLLLILAFSLRWRMVHDTPLLHYVAFLMDRYHLVLYRDVFETSMPGTFLFHLAIGKWFGYGDLAFRLVDIAWLGLLLAATFRFMSLFGRRAAWAGAVLFTLAYYQLGHNAVLQRDYLGLLPLALAACLAVSAGRLRVGWRAFFIGLLFGAAASVKPHLALGLVTIFFLPGLIATAGTDKARGKFFLPLLLPALAGFVLPLFFCLCWLWRMGALPYFWEMVTRYLPLHVQLSGEHRLLCGWEKVRYLLAGFVKLGGHALWLVPALAGVFFAWHRAGLSSRQKKAIWLLLTLTLVYAIYPVLSGQFWDYHWIPFLYCVILLASLLLTPWPDKGRRNWPRLVPVAILALFVLIIVRPPQDFLLQVRGRPLPPPKHGTVDELAAFLQAQVGPADTVQPLDWVGGAIQAMLLARARIATPFLYDYHFYHHVSNPYIQKLRARFIEKLEQAKPKFVIEVTSMHKGKVSGRDTSDTFPELRRLLAAEYLIQETNRRYTIFRRKITLFN